MRTNKIKGSCSKQLANNPNTPAPTFTFKPYDADHSPFYNNPENIDFVTYNGSLYVCVYDGSTYQAGSPSANNFLLLVEKGKDGRQGIDGKPGPVGPKPGYRMRFNGKQLEIFNEDGTREAVSDELVGPAWIPELYDHKIVWRINDDGSVPSDIDLDQLRPIEENPILFRLNSDNTKREDEETGPGYYIQWKREGNEHWTNLMSISELMNIALAGICFWWEPDKNGVTDVNGKVIERLHLGHKQVVKATYDSSKLGNKKIAEVVLGDVLFDAGEIPFPNYDDAIAALNSYICDLEEDLNAIHIPTKLSEFTNDVPYIRTVNGHAPDNDNGRFDLKVKTIDGNDIVGDAGDLALKKVNGYKLIKTLDDPDDIWINLNDSYTKEESDNKYQPKGNYVEKVQLNDNEPVAPVNGIVKLTIGDYDLTKYVKKTDLAKINNQVLYRGGNISINNWDSIGLEDVEIRVNSGKLQYRKKEDGSFGSWSDIMVISAGGDGEHVELKIENGSLYIKYNEGEFEKVGDVGSGSGTGSGDTVNGFVNVSINGSILTFTRQDGTTKNIQLPTSAGGTGITEDEAKTLIGQILEGVLDNAIPEYVRQNGHNYFVRINELNNLLSNYYTKSQIDNNFYTKAQVDEKIAGGGSGGGSSTGSVVIADLTNEIDPVPVNDNSVVQRTMTFTTTGRMWKDGQELTVTSVSTTYSKSGIHITTSGANCTIVVDENVVLDSTQEIWFNITADGTTKQVAYKLVPIKALPGSTYGLVINPTAIVIDKNGNYSVEEINVNTYWLDNGEIKTPAGWDSTNDNMSSWKVWYYVDDSETGTRYTTDSNLNLDFIRTINKQIRFELKSSAAGNVKVIDTETIPIIRDGSDGDSISITNQTRYYKASRDVTGVTAPASNLDPTLPENGSWTTNSNSVTLDSTNAYLWMFERIVYSNSIWQSDPVVIRFFNDQVDIDYDTLANEVKDKISDDLDSANTRITNAENRLNNIDSEITGINTTTDDLTGRVTAVEARATYTDEGIKSLAEEVIDAEKGTIISNAVSQANDNTTTQINSVNQTLNSHDGRIRSNAVSIRDISDNIEVLEGKITTAETEITTVKADLDSKAGTAEIAATKQEVKQYADGKITESINSARTEWEAADAAITSTVYTKTETDNKMSVIQQRSDKIWAAVGDGDNVKAAISIISDAETNNGKIVLDANKIELNGETTANSLNSYFADVSNANIDNLHATNADVSGNITATSGNINGILSMGSNGGIALDGGTSIGSSYLNSSGIGVVGNGSKSVVSGKSIKVVEIPTHSDTEHSVEITYSGINKVTTDLLHNNSQKTPVLWGVLNKLSDIKVLSESEYNNTTKNSTTLYIVI